MHAAGATLSPLWALPFAALLLSIAILPLLAAHFWHRRYPLVCLVLAVPVIAYFSYADPHRLSETALDYASFIILLGSLFVVTSGVVVEGGVTASPIGNTLYLATGAFIANAIGTTGASMLLIRPLIRANRHRHRVGHVFIFFIFLVSNIGGALTPLGDPPLFLGYLEGVPFTWTLRLVPQWITTVGIVLAVFFLFDSVLARGETATDETFEVRTAGRLQLEGKRNLIYLAGVVLCIFIDRPLRELGMLAMALLSYQTTPESVHDRNEFSLGPIREVAILFAGIFATMIPALAVLQQNGASLGVNEPWEFFWATGLLSSFLDNAPTYLTFLSAARGLGLPAEVVGVPNDLLAAISCGAVFMGANSYIGNGPNFMVKAIVEENGIAMPSFFGYMAYSCAILVPAFIVVTSLFFR